MFLFIEQHAELGAVPAGTTDLVKLVLHVKDPIIVVVWGSSKTAVMFSILCHPVFGEIKY